MKTGFERGGTVPWEAGAQQPEAQLGAMIPRGSWIEQRFRWKHKQ